MTASELRRRYLVVQGLRWLGPGFLTPVLTLMLLDGGLSLAQVGVVIATYSTTILLLELPTGGLADAVGPKRVLLVSAALNTLATAILAVGQGMGPMLAGGVVLGVGRALDSGPLESWYVTGVRQADPEHDVTGGLGTGAMVAGIALGIGALAAGLAPKILTGDGVLSPLRLPALLATLFGVVHLVAVATLLPRVAEGEGLGRLRAEVRRVPTIVREAAGVARSSLAVRRLLLVVVVFGLAWVPLELLWQPHLADLLGGAAENTEVFGFLATAAFFASAAGSWVGPRLATWVGARDRAGMIGLSGLVVALIGFAIAPSPWWAAAAFTVAYVSEGVWSPLQKSLLHDSVDDAHRTTVLSGVSLSLQLSAVGTQLTLMPLAGHFGLRPVFAIMAGLATVAVLLHLGLEEVVRRDRPAPASPVEGESLASA